MAQYPRSIQHLHVSASTQGESQTTPSLSALWLIFVVLKKKNQKNANKTNLATTPLWGGGRLSLSFDHDLGTR